ncbi:hypothetical protein [Tahibacter soli]|uniref:Lipoprotein n=1 Tax=Tahibacter soli TaxID=2983605 RepID=A0A9X3YR96_9GAMM|nr:hypothetical protein [Tahibacter soli]MDC8014866.1 hypothetical protein [Tahibacter soli]
MKPLRLALLSLVVVPLAACGGSPENLAKDVQTVFEKGDMDGALKLADLDTTPAQLRFFYLDGVHDCGQASITCTAKAEPLDDAFKKRLESLGPQGLESVAAPEGVIVVEQKSADGKSNGKLRMPYGKVGGKYRIISQRYTAAKLTEMRAQTNEQLLQQMLAAGIYDSEKGERSTTWKDTATALPADGGEPGQSLVRTSAALYAAASANDPDAAVKSGDGFAAMVLADKDYEGKPVPLADRKSKMRAQAYRFLHDVKVSGGWIRGDEAIVLVDAKDGAGWVSRGALFMMKRDGAWSVAGKETVEYPM